MPKLHPEVLISGLRALSSESSHRALISTIKEMAVLPKRPQADIMATLKALAKKVYKTFQDSPYLKH